LRATETGALARSVDTPAFIFDRPTAPVTVVSPVADVIFRENAVTSINVDVRTALGTDAAEDITLVDGSALPARFVKTALGAGVFKIDGTFANNEILSFTVKYSGTLSGNPVVSDPNEPSAPTFKSEHNAPVPAVISVSALNDNPVTLSVSMLSDDANNLVEAGTVVASIGSATLSADRKIITVTPLTDYVGPVTVNYTLRAPDDTKPVATTATVTFSAVQPPRALQEILTSSVDGTAMTPVNLLQYFAAGSYPIDAASLEFVDSATGTRVGKSRVIAGVGTFTINAAGDFSFSATAGHTGVTILYDTIADVRGRFMPIAVKHTHTQTSSGTSQNPFPNTLDGKAILGLGHNHRSEERRVGKECRSRWSPYH